MNIVEHLKNGWRKIGIPETEIEALHFSMRRESTLKSELWSFEDHCEKSGIKPTYTRYKRYLKAQETATTDHIKGYIKKAAKTGV